MNRAYVFVDGENHFQRSRDVAKEVFGDDRAHLALGQVEKIVPGESAFPSHLGVSLDGIRDDSRLRKVFLVDAPSMLFWDRLVLPFRQLDVLRAVYVTCSSPGDAKSTIQKTIRECGFEPLVIEEIKPARMQRANLKKSEGLIDKAKGCDIALATRMVADAASNLYDICCLFTSDTDFLPAVVAVRAMGKKVFVFGYMRFLKKKENSSYLYVPDQFIDLESTLAGRFNRQEVEQAIAELGEVSPV